MESLLKISKPQLIDVSCGVRMTLSTSGENGPEPTLTIPVATQTAATTAAPAAVTPPALAVLEPLEDLLDPSFCFSLRRFSFFLGDLFSLLEAGLSFISSRRRSLLSK